MLIINDFRRVRDEIRHYRTNLPFISEFLSNLELTHIMDNKRYIERDMVRNDLDGVVNYYMMKATSYAQTGQLYEFRMSIIMAREIRKIIVDLGYEIHVDCPKFDKDLRNKCRRQHANHSTITKSRWSNGDKELYRAIKLHRRRSKTSGVDPLWCK